MFKVTLNYTDGPLIIETEQFSSIDEIKEELLFNPAKNLMITDTASNGRMVKTDFISAKIEQIIDGNIISEYTIDKATGEPISSPVAEIVEIPEEKEVMSEVIEPEVMPEIDNLPEIPTKFKSFRDFFLEQNRVQNSWLQSIAEKMQKRNEVLKAIDNRLDEENDAVEALRTKFIGK